MKRPAGETKRVLFDCGSGVLESGRAARARPSPRTEGWLDLEPALGCARDRIQGFCDWKPILGNSNGASSILLG